MAPLPVDIFLGIYLGVLTGIIPALVAGALGFLFKYVTNVTLPGFGVVVLGVALAGVNGGLLALADPAVLQSANAAVVMTGLLVVMMMTLYAHAQGDKLGASLPKRISLRKLGEQTLSTDLTEVVGGRKEVRIQVASVEDIEGYPPLPAALRTAITDSEWRLPADLQVSELEARLAERVRTEHDLGDVTVSIDDKGSATVAAAPPFSGLSRRVGSGKRAVSVDALVPSGLARGDVVTAHAAGDSVRGTVLSARSSAVDSAAPPPAASEATDGEKPPAATAAPTTKGGQGQVTLGVSRADVEALLSADRAKVVVGSRATGREYEVISLLRRAGRRFDRVTVRAGGPLDGTRASVQDIRDSHDVLVLGARTDDRWQFAPRGTLALAAGDELFAVGTTDALAAFSEAVA
jgi:hypothetical protein